MRQKYKPRTEPYTIEWLERWIIPEPNSGCWLWIGSVNAGGYGSVGLNGKTQGAHRVSYILANGNILDGMDLDHLCRVRCCVNPDHLEPVTRSENLRRGDAGKLLAAHATAITHCPNGHPYSGDNLYVSAGGSRNCVICQRQRVRDWRTRQRILRCEGEAA